ncbi:MAG TPA: acyl-CoA reductase, partial [Longimicrobiaceae bacterium]|nr:acyl-CoA reductase [Longimicrobiaceae bacterium]
EALLSAREQHLAHRPVGEVVAVVDAVAARLLDGGDELRQSAERALPLVTGYSLPMVRRVLDRMAADWRTGPLRALLRAEFGDPRVLDGFRPRSHGPGEERVYGPRLTAHVFSGNVPGVAVTSLVRALLVKSASLGKTAVGEPVLAALFARAVAREDAGLGQCLAVTYWAGGDEQMERAALERADAVIAYGGAESVAAVRGRSPAGARFLGYGSRISFGVVGREALAAAEAERIAAECALDASTFDQQGCVSPHLFYVEEGGETTPQAWARLLGDAMAATEGELPRGALAPRESSAIRQLRGEAEFAQISGTGVEVHASAEGTAWTVVYDPDPAFSASCLNRVVRVKPVADLADVPGLVERVGPVLQTVGLAASGERRRELADALGRLGASRVVPMGQMAWPPPSWHHDGHPPLRELVRWCDLEG